MRLREGFVWLALMVAVGWPGPALAAFHLMEIEQVIGGVGGDTTAQAVQLKMRFAGQQFVGGNARLVARDAAGVNPVVLSTFPVANPDSGACREILLATTGFAARTTPSVGAAQRDFLMDPIPVAYLPAGSLTFEGAGGSPVYWRVSWGGASYTGSGTVVSVGAGGNDDDGNANPPFAGALPSTNLQALRFTPACAAVSTNNAAQYALTAGTAVFTNNDLAAFTVVGPPPGVPVLPAPAGLALVVALGALAAASIVLRARGSAAKRG
jgi:hypothetical protein